MGQRPRVSDQARQRFAATPGSVREARSFLRRAIAGVADAQTTTDLTLALSELASNAVRHARTPFEVVVVADGLVRIEVMDGSTDGVIVRDASEAGGRGLPIVDQLCDRWGVRMLPEGKSVWCERDLSARGAVGTEGIDR
jgi:anti-sigma regulatory factor (Ser/Thr protein kinase)